jgi:GT2 family glycosyltransferase
MGKYFRYPMISIIVPTRELKRSKNLKYLHKKLTSIGDLLESVERIKDQEFEVIVVVNGETDKKLIDFIKNHQKVSKYAIISSNAGVSRAWNIGRNLAEGDLLLFLNDDVVIGKNDLYLLKSTINENVVMVGPKGSVWEKGEHVSYSDNDDVNVISGFAFMIKSKVFDEIGGIDINFTPAGYEEIDLSFKVLKAGYLLKTVPESQFTTNPVHGISAKNTDINYFNTKINTKVLHERNTKYFKDKWGLVKE